MPPKDFFARRPQPLNIVSLVIDPEYPLTVSARIVNNHERSDAESRLDDQPVNPKRMGIAGKSPALRTVHFLPDEVLFECKTRMACECGRLSDSDSGIPFVWPPENVVGTSNLHMNWTNLVESFKSRSLTFADDALPALSGIAQRTLPLSPGQYYAGIWEKDIAIQLGWIQDPFQTLRNEKQQADLHPLPGPTFSWATFPGPVRFLNRTETAICALIDGRIIPVADDIYGQIKEASLRMRGHSIGGAEMVREVQANKSFNCHLPKTHQYPIAVYLDRAQSFPPRDSYRIPRNQWYDSLEVVWNWSKVICLGLCVDDDQNTVTMLLLEPAAKEDSFVRIGVVANFPRPWFDELASGSIVTIV